MSATAVLAIGCFAAFFISGFWTRSWVVVALAAPIWPGLYALYEINVWDLLGFDAETALSSAILTACSVAGATFGVVAGRRWLGALE